MERCCRKTSTGLVGSSSRCTAASDQRACGGCSQLAHTGCLCIESSTAAASHLPACALLLISAGISRQMPW